MWRRFLRSDEDLFVRVPLDPASLKAADHREYREQRAESSIVSVKVETAEQIRQRQFWEHVDASRNTRGNVRAFQRGQVRA